MTQRGPDIIDLLAGIAPGDPLDEVRSRRPQARENAQRSFEALLEPADPGTFLLAERYAISAFVAALHGFDRAAEFYGDLLGDEAAGLAAVVDGAARSGATRGPYGDYREPALQGENVAGLRWTPDAATVAAGGERLAAALAHAHLLVFRPREARPEALRALADAGWDADDIVSLSQLIAFLTFQVRVAWALRVLAANPAAPHPAGTGATTQEGA